MALIALEFFLFTKIQEQTQAAGIHSAAVLQIQETEGLNAEVPADPNAGKLPVAVLITISVVNGIAILILVAFFVVPDFGEFLGSQVYSPDREERKESPYAPALAAYNQGNYEQAVDVYMALARENPDDIHAVCEAAKITATKLGNPDGGLVIIENYLELDHSQEIAAQLASFLADMAIREKRDYDYAAVVHQQVINSMPGTPHAIHAAAELRKLEPHLSNPPVDEPGAVEGLTTSATPEDERANYRA